MKAPNFHYVRPSSLDETLQLLEQHGDDAKVLAGGQSLIAALNMRLSSPTIVIDINGLSDLGGIHVSNTTVHIGALTRHRVVEHSTDIAKHLPLISQAMPHVAHVAIRNRGTFGGSIAFADPAAELPACSVALDAQFVIASRKGERRVPARDFFRGMYEIDLRPEELLIGGDFPVLKPGYRSTFLELARRQGDYAIVGVAAYGAYQNNRYSDVSIVFFGVGATPIQATAVASALEGLPFSHDTVAAAQAAVSTDVSPYGDLYQSADTKAHLTRVLVKRAVMALATHKE